MNGLILNWQIWEWYQTSYLSVRWQVSVFPRNVKPPLQIKVSAVRESRAPVWIKLWAIIRGGFSPLFFSSSFSLSSRHHSACFLCLSDLEGLWESSVVCVYVSICVCWILNNNYPGKQPTFVPVCSQGPHALIKSNLIQMLYPPVAPTRHQPIKQAPLDPSLVI